MTRTCIYCQASGPETHFQLTGPPGVQQNWACRQANLCVLRTLLPLYPGQDAGELVHAVLTLVRELAQAARQDTEARNAAGPPGSPERRDFRGMLSGTDLARLHLVLEAAAYRIDGSGRAEWGRQLEQARAGYGCPTCGAIGREDCATVTGVTQVPRVHSTRGPRWHAGRTL